MNRTISVRPIILFLLYFIPNSLLIADDFIRIACVGDSITYGYGLINKEHSYPAQLEDSLPETWEIRNYGVSGACAGSGFPDSYLQTSKPEEIREWNPNIIFFMLGSNDSKDEYWVSPDFFIQGYEKIIRSISSSETIVVLMLPPPSGINTFGINNTVLQNEIIPAIRFFAEYNNYPLLDFSESIEIHKFQYLDNVHLNSRGYRIIKDRIINYLKENYSIDEPLQSPN